MFYCLNTGLHVNIIVGHDTLVTAGTKVLIHQGSPEVKKKLKSSSGVKVRFIWKINTKYNFKMTANHEIAEQTNEVAHLVFKSHCLLTGVEDQCKARVIPAGEHLTTPLITFPLYSDASRLNTFHRHVNGWRLLHFWCLVFFPLSQLLLNDSHFHTFAKQWSGHSQLYRCSW